MKAHSAQRRRFRTFRLLMAGLASAGVCVMSTASLAQDAAPAQSPSPGVADAAATQAQPAIEVGQMVRVSLSGGAQVTASLLRQGPDGVILDLGHDLMRLAANRIVSIAPVGQDGDSDAAVSNEDIFAVGRLTPRSTPELVETWGDSVVLIRTPTGLGTGFVISSDGHVVTNYHVVERQTRISVTLFRATDRGFEREETGRVRLIALNPLRDLALLRIDPADLEGSMPRPVMISADGNMKVGTTVFAIGAPLGLERSVTQGIVSSAKRTIGHLRFLQTDAAINPGNSGGPMFNLRGEVVGVVCAGASFFDGLAFGIPAADLIDFLRHRDAFLYDPSQPQNGVKYLDPPGALRPATGDASSTPDAADAASR